MSMGPLEQMMSDPTFIHFIEKWLNENEASLLRILRAHARRWKIEEAAAVISNTDGALTLIDRFRKHLSAELAKERAASNKTLLKGIKNA